MRLKKIELTGFKSFMDHTVLPVPTNIAAIVGPNGCGKSNIVDACMWAMGEMRPTRLRGHSLEDVIFNGTESLKPVGMAEVSLVFENGTGTPIKGYEECGEVTVTRRLFRSGDSEYYINKVGCRLKDVRDLFLGTGAGINAYSIIEQGQVEMLINARPQERRHLIEEAAGVTIFKERKRETLLKMDRTRQNLLRVQDIIGEVHRQMNSLRRQAVQARKYREYRDEIKVLDVTLALSEFAQLNEELKAVGVSLLGGKEDEAAQLSQMSSVESSLEEVKRRLVEIEERFSTLQREIYRIEGDIQREEERIHAFERERESLGGLIGQYQEEIEGIIAENTRLAEKQVAHEYDATDIRENLERIRDVLVAKEDQLQVAETSCTAQERVLEEIKREIMETSLRLTHYQNVIEDSGKRTEDYKGRRAKFEEELQGVREERERIAAEIRSAEEEQERINQRIEALEKRSAEHALLAEACEGKLSERESRVKETEGALYTAQLQLHSLLEMQSRYEGYNEGVKALMGTEDTSVKSGLVATLGDLIEVDSRYEAAVEAVLGRELRSLLVRRKDDAFKAISYLKAAELGRATFVPLNPLQAISSENTAPQQRHGEGIPGPLAEFVRVPESYAGLVRNLLDEVWLVEDLSHVAKSNRVGEGVFVTPDGDVLDRRGILTGGSPDIRSGILTRKREIGSLETAVDRLETGYSEASKELLAAQQTLGRLKKELELFRAEGFELEKERMRVAGKGEDIRRALAANERKEEALGYEIGRIEVEATQLKEEVDDAQTRIAELTSLKEQAEQRLGALRNDLEQRWNERDALRNNVTALRVEKASFSEREGNLVAGLEELARMIASLTLRRETKEQQINAARRRVEEAVQGAGQRRQHLAALIRTRDEKKRVTAKEGADVEEFRNAIRDQEAVLKRLQSELQEIRDALAQQEIKRSEIDLTIRHVRDRIYERYGLSLASVGESAEWAPLEDVTAGRERLADLRTKIERLGDVNPGAVDEYEELKERFEFLEGQREDLQRSLDTLTKTINEINRTSTERFKETFVRANEQFQRLVARLFDGGRGELTLDDSTGEPGVNVTIQPPGKRLKNMEMLSGGEKAMVSVAFIFSLFLLRPTPFCLLDELDSPLDDHNVDRFIDLLREMSRDSQFLLITHNKRSMQAAEVLYGVTMETPGVSKLVSVKLN